METFSALPALCAGNSSVTCEFPSQGQWRRALKFSLICTCTNDLVNNRDAGDMGRHRSHYDATVMFHSFPHCFDLCQLRSSKCQHINALSVLLVICVGTPPQIHDSLHKGSVMPTIHDFLFVSLNELVNNQVADDWGHLDAHMMSLTFNV